MRVRLVLCLLVLGACVAPGVAQGAAMWNNGVLQESSIIDCISIINGSPTSEAGLGAYTSVYEDYNSPPSANQAYYLAVTLFGIGNPCSGQAADIAITLPANTTPDISAVTPVVCIPLESQGNSVVDGAPDTSGGCPQSPTALGNNTYRFDMAQDTGFFATMFYPFWGIAQGDGIEMHIPVVTTAALPNGTATGVIQLADGNDNPTLRPTVAVIVGAAATPAQGTAYAVNSPTVTNITDTSATLSATFVIDYNIAPDEAEFDWGVANPPAFGLGESLDYAAGKTPYEDQRGFALTGLQPGCTYHWAAKLSAGANVLAHTGDLTFTTTGTSNGSCTIASGGGTGPTGQPQMQLVQPLAPTGTPPKLVTPPPPEPPIKPPATTTTQTTPPPPPPPPSGDHITKLTVASHTIHAGSSLTVEVTLATASKVTVTIVRHVPASGHGRHRKKAHDVTLGTKTFTGTVGLNKLKLTTLNGHRLAKGSYTAKVTAGGKSHSVSFVVH